MRRSCFRVPAVLVTALIWSKRRTPMLPTRLLIGDWTLTNAEMSQISPSSFRVGLHEAEPFYSARRSAEFKSWTSFGLRAQAPASPLRPPAPRAAPPLSVRSNSSFLSAVSFVHEALYAVAVCFYDQRIAQGELCTLQDLNKLCVLRATSSKCS